MGTDARVRYTKMVIKESFLKILKQKNLDKITVTEICENAVINRATFYKYYDNPFDLFNKLEEELLDRLEDTILSQNSGNFLMVFRTVLEDIQKNREIYNLLFSENGDEQFRSRLFSLCYGENMESIRRIFPNASNKEQEWIYFFIAEGCNGILMRWMSNDMQDSVDDIVHFTEKIVNSILLSSSIR